MKKLYTSLVMFALLACLSSVSHAGSPQEQGAQLSGRFSHTSIQGSTTSLNSPQTVSIAVVPPSALNSGGLSTSFANCFTRFEFEIATGSVVNVYDGPVVSSNAVKTFYGAALGTGVLNTISIPEDHLGPLCLTPGNTTNIVISSFSAQSLNQAGISTNGNTANYEGYTSAGPGSISN